MIHRFEDLLRGTTSVCIEKVRCGSAVAHIPVARIVGKEKGPTLVVTAGIDGDEYAGIIASYGLIREFSTRDLKGTLIVIPVVNVFGFDKEVSYNPLDDTFPKYIYPGTSSGTPTEQLMYWVHESCVKGASAWVDLHGGALTECLAPFVALWETGNKSVDATTEKLLNTLPIKTVIYQKALQQRKAKVLSGIGCCYVLSESGEFVARYAKDSTRHIGIVHAVMGALGMIDDTKRHHAKTIFHALHTYQIKKNGVWYPSFEKPIHITKGQTLGVVHSLVDKKVEMIRAHEGGVLVWGKQGLRAKRGDVIAAIANDAS